MDEIIKKLEECEKDIIGLQCMITRVLSFCLEIKNNFVKYP